MGMVEIAPFDAQDASDDELRPVYELQLELDAELEPDDPVTPFGEFVEDWRRHPPHRKVWHWVARDGGDVAGYSWLSAEYVETNRHLAWSYIAVRQPHRGAHVATRLLQPLIDVAAQEGRAVLGSDAVEDASGSGFLSTLGFEKRSIERRSRLVVKDVDTAMLQGWVDRAPERAADYELISWEQSCPEELLEPFVHLAHVMNTAPRDDLDMEDWLHTPDRQRENEERNAAKGYTLWTMCARHKPTGELAGYTELNFSKWRPSLAWQGDTGVEPKHRERGLGRWLKAAMLLRAMEEHPEVEFIDTWNANSNDAMLGINVAMGYRPLRMYGDWQIATADLAEAVAKRV